MAKYVVKYEREVDGKTITITKTRYVTTDISNPHRTRGKSKVLGGVLKFYIRAGRLLSRVPGVMRRSKKVREVNAALVLQRGKKSHPAVQCAGLDWRGFTKCLSNHMKEALKAADYKPEKAGEPISATDWLKVAYGSTPVESKEEALALVE